jgi:Domain of unknown function (DUF4262)
MPIVGEVDLPDPEDDFDEKLLADIREYGWHCVLVDPGAHPEHPELPPHAVYDASFAYTVGLHLTHRHADIILVGRWQHAQALLTNVVALIEEGRRFEAGDESDQVMAEYPVRFGEVAEAHRKELMTYADWAYRREPAAALQLVIPDAAGRWPYDPGYDSQPQPMLD